MIKRAIIALLLAFPAASSAQVFLPDTSGMTDEQRMEVLRRLAELELLRLEGETEEYIRRVDARDPEGYQAQCRPVDGEQRRFAASESLPEMKVALGDPVAHFSRDYPRYFPYNSKYPDRFYLSQNSGQMMRLAVDLGGVIIRSRTGGLGNTVNRFRGTINSQALYHLSFYDQQCPLLLDQALTRANALETRLQEAGFVRDGERAMLDAAETYGPMQTVQQLASWEDARPQLAITPRRFAQVTSYWVRGEERGEVTVHNWGIYADPQRDARFSVNVFEIDGTGRKYGVELTLENRAAFERDRQAR